MMKRKSAAAQANYTLVALHWFTAVVGPEVWRTGLFELLHLSPPAWLPARLQRAAVNELVTTMVRPKLGRLQNLSTI